MKNDLTGSRIRAKPRPVSVEKVLVLGGGSAGWIVAAHLARHRPDLDITVIESTDIPTVSVGESMNPISRLWNDALGIDERAFMRACDASYKIGIQFEGFRARGERFFHPFGYPRRPLRFRPNADVEYASTHAAAAGGSISGSRSGTAITSTRGSTARFCGASRWSGA